MSYHSYYSVHKGSPGDPCVIIYPQTGVLATGTIKHHERNSRSEHILITLSDGYTRGD